MVTATQFQIDCSLMAGGAYQSTRPGTNNRFPVPPGWTEVPGSHQVNSSGGFEAVTYTNGSQYVMSFAGTSQTVDWIANCGLATGAGAGQLEDAALYFVRFMATHAGANVTFTGHSLGGGLAALMGVYFDRPAVTFDPAFFGKSIKPVIRDQVVDSFYRNGYSYTEVSAMAPELRSFTLETLAPRLAKITGLYVQGEALHNWGTSFIGSLTLIPQGSSPSTSSVDLHSEALLSAFALNEAFAAVTSKLPDLVNMAFDGNLFANKTDTDRRNLVEHLIRHQVGVTGPGAITPDNMLDRFTADLQKVAQDGGLTLTNELVSKTLVAFAMQKYYEEKAGDPDVGQKLFTDVSGGIRFDRTVVADQLAGAKGYNLYFKAYLDSLPAADKALITTLLPAATEWFVQAGGTSLGATGATQRAFMLGGTGSDALTGGTAADLLVGNLEADVLNGGAGNDTLNVIAMTARSNGLDQPTPPCRRTRRASVPARLRARGRGARGTRASSHQRLDLLTNSVASANWLRRSGTVTRHACGLGGERYQSQNVHLMRPINTKLPDRRTGIANAYRPVTTEHPKAPA